MVELIPGCAPGTVDWYDAHAVVEDDGVVDIWPVIPRGPGHGGLIRWRLPATAITALSATSKREGMVVYDERDGSLSNERTALDLEDAARMNVHALAVQVFVGGEHETQSVPNMTSLVDAGYRYAIPVLGVTAVGKELAGDAHCLGLATRMCAELGAQFVETYYCAEGFERVTAGRPVPIVMAGGKKLPEPEALEMAYRAVQEAASGVDVGRNELFREPAYEQNGDHPPRRQTPKPPRADHQTYQSGKETGRSTEDGRTNGSCPHRSVGNDRGRHRSRAVYRRHRRLGWRDQGDR